MKNEIGENVAEKLWLSCFQNKQKINLAWWFNYKLMKGLGCLCPMWFLDKCVKGE